MTIRLTVIVGNARSPADVTGAGNVGTVGEADPVLAMNKGSPTNANTARNSASIPRNMIQMDAFTTKSSKDGGPPKYAWKLA